MLNGNEKLEDFTGGSFSMVFRLNANPWANNPIRRFKYTQFTTLPSELVP